MAQTGSHEKLEGGRIKGSMIRSRFEWLKENHPDLEREAIISALPEATAARFARGLLSSGWYEFEDLIHLDKHLWERFHDATPEIIKDFGRTSARNNVTTVFLSMTPHEFFRGSVKLHDRFQDFGSAAYQQTGERSGKMVYLDYPCYSPVFCESAFGFFEQCLILFGAQTPEVTEPQCHCRGQTSCTFSLSWS